MHLLLGQLDDPCCHGVYAELRARGEPVQTIANPLTEPSRFSWRLDSRQSHSELTWDGVTTSGDQISSVFVRANGWIDPAGWEGGDLAYVQAETSAALLAWLWSLPGPVVNRYPAWLWYCLAPPLLSWNRRLRRAGLPGPRLLVSNAGDELRDFRRGLAATGVRGAVYGPLTSGSHYLISSDADWAGLAALLPHAPVCLALPHEAPQLACAVGTSVIWDAEPSLELTSLEPAIRRFAGLTGLTFVELAFARTASGTEVVAVEPFPELRHFGPTAQQRIIGSLVDLLTAPCGERGRDVASTAGGAAP
jgi:hypothetical protein